MSTLNQQTLVDSGANERPPMLEKWNYIPWESRFRRFLDNKLEEGDQMWRSIEKGPYKRPMIHNLNNTTEQILEPLSKMIKGNKKQYIADVKVVNYLLQSIPNDIYNSVDASKEGESLESVYERLTILVNIMDRNNVRPLSVSINTKFLNCLQPEWSKYVTTVRHNQTGDVVSYDELYDSLIQFEPHVLASKAKKYVTHPSSITDYEDEYHGELQGDSQEDKLTTAMMLLARAITQKFSIPTNNHLRTSSTTRNQAVVQDGRVDIKTMNAGYDGNGNRNAGRQNMNQAFNAGNSNNESNQIVQRVP
ncbi:hypothetical protein Tco_0740354 [Tanacetum coccineum]